MTNYTNGRRAEYLARTALLMAGYNVLRAAGSKGPVDLIAWNDQTTRFIQVKKGKGAARPAEIDALRKLSLPPLASVELWVRLRGKWELQVLAHTHPPAAHS